jgi:hypothetical protein
MRSLFTMALVLGAAALLVPALPAQQPPGMPGANLMLLLNKDVQKELKLSDEQIDKAKKVSPDVLQKHRSDLPALVGPLPGQQGDDQAKKLLKLSRQITDETIEAMGDALKPEQGTRLKQIAMQQAVQSAGVLVFTDPDVDKALKLTDKQKDDLKKMADDQKKKQQEAIKGAGADIRELNKKVGQVNKDAVEDAVKALTDDQKKKWKELTGEPFELKSGTSLVPPGGKESEKKEK